MILDQASASNDQVALRGSRKRSADLPEIRRSEDFGHSVRLVTSRALDLKEKVNTTEIIRFVTTDQEEGQIAHV